MTIEDVERALHGDGGGAAIAVPFFDGQTAAFEGSDLDPDAVLSAMRAFLALGAADRDKAAPHVFAYCREVLEEIGEHELDGPPPVTPDDVWRLVQPRGIDIVEEDGSVFVMVECDCDWEPEHGLLMVWREGRVIEKVGGYDGHATNVHAYDDESLAHVVYAGADPRFTTVKPS